jgi:hypothetical protein
VRDARQYVAPTCVRGTSAATDQEEHDLITTTNTLRTLVVTAIGAGAVAVAVGALTASAPAMAAPTQAVTSIQPTCEQHPRLYASGAVLGVYSTQRRGVDRDQICKDLRPEPQADRRVHEDGLRLLPAARRTPADPGAEPALAAPSTALSNSAHRIAAATMTLLANFRCAPEVDR